MHVLLYVQLLSKSEQSVSRETQKSYENITFLCWNIVEVASYIDLYLSRYDIAVKDKDHLYYILLTLIVILKSYWVVEIVLSVCRADDADCRWE